MPAFFIYLLKANIALTICYLAYRFGLRRLTFYATNRFFLLFGIAFAALFPLIDLTRLFNGRAQLAGGISHYTPDWNALQQYLQSRDTFTLWDLLQYIFWAGVVVMTARFFIQLISLWRIHTGSVTGRVNGSRVKIMQQPVNPFSFFRNIYLNPSLHAREEIAAIIIHEKVHVKGWHSADVMAGELNNIFYWFNPGAWLMKTAIRENLEFIVDRKILQSGMDAKAYQYSLIKVSGVTYAAAIANNFNFSHLKQRIMMMNKKRSGRINILRYVLLLPLMTAIVLFIFTSSKGQKGITSNNTALVLRSDTVPPAPLPPPPPVPPAGLRKVPPPPPAPVSPPASPKPEVKFTPPTVVRDSEPPVSMYPTPVTGEEKMRVVIRDPHPQNQPLIVVDGKESPSGLKKIDPNSIESINVLKDTAAINKYGEKGRHGVIEITLKNLDNGVAGIKVAGIKKETSVTVPAQPGIILRDSASPKIILRGLKADARPLVLVDGHVGSLDSLKPAAIKSITVLKDESAVSTYGKKGKGGVIIITTKKNGK